MLRPERLTALPPDAACVTVPEGAGCSLGAGVRRPEAAVPAPAASKRSTPHHREIDLSQCGEDESDGDPISPTPASEHERDEDPMSPTPASEDESDGDPISPTPSLII